MYIKIHFLVFCHHLLTLASSSYNLASSVTNMFSGLSILAANSEFGYQRFEVKAGAMTLLGGGVANKVAVGRVLTFPFTLNSKYESQLYQVSV